MHQTPIKSIKHSRILFSPLNWGLGHVSRTVPVIQELIENKNEVILFCDEKQEAFYRHFFPEIWYVPHDGYPFQFNGNGRWAIDILKNFSALHLFLQEEKNKVKEWVEKFNPDLIISDQRYGFISKKVKSIVISHQLTLPVSKWNFLTHFWNRKLLARFDEIWIPDISNQAMSGKLSAGKHKDKYFIGACSRFYNTSKSEVDQKEETYEYLGIVSGPAPYNQQLLDLLKKKLEKVKGRSAIIVPENLYDEQLNSSQVKVFSNPNHQKFCELLFNSKVVISRSGYSTLMDLEVTQKEGILIPTPGQTEQIYLAYLHKNHKNWKFKTEEEFLEMSL